MEAIGLDIGTTTLCGVALDARSGDILAKITVKNRAALGGQPFENLQDPGCILEDARGILAKLLAACRRVAGIGLTGQMHGILYLDGGGRAAGPLYTWQDGRGNLPCREGLTWAGWLRRETGYPVASGYGALTHFYCLQNGLVPPQAAGFCTIADYVAMRLAGRGSPLLHPTLAASLGCFDLAGRRFDRGALERAGLWGLFPPVLDGCPLLGAAGGIPVAAAIGDNQASVLGAAREPEDAVLINIGTGSQISVVARALPARGESEARPYFDGGYLCVGSPLCGGRAWAALEKFFRQTVEMALGRDPGILYGQMAAMLEKRGLGASALVADTRYCGTRADPLARGGFTGLGLDSFSPAEFAYSVLAGMAEELYQYFLQICADTGRKPGSYRALVGSGNGVRKNPFLQRLLARRFGLGLLLPAHEEEAACGAALFALAAAGACPGLRQAQALLRYQ